MNEGLEQRTLQVDTGACERLEAWWTETKKMVDRGFERMMRQGRGWREMTMRDQIHAEMEECKGAKKRKG